MRVFISFGSSTAQVESALKSRFPSGEIRVSSGDTIESVERVFNRGDYFDRAVIAQGGLTGGGADLDTIRSRAEWFTGILNSKAQEATCLFLVSDKDIARVLAEETIVLGERCRVILKKPPFDVNYIVGLAHKNIDIILKEGGLYDFRNEGVQDNQQATVGVVYSTFQEDKNTCEKLESVGEVDASNIFQEPESSEANHCSSETEETTLETVTNFDDFFNSEGDYDQGSSSAVNETNTSHTEPAECTTEKEAENTASSSSCESEHAIASRLHDRITNRVYSIPSEECTEQEENSEVIELTPVDEVQLDDTENRAKTKEQATEDTDTDILYIEDDIEEGAVFNDSEIKTYDDSQQESALENIEDIKEPEPKEESPFSNIANYTKSQNTDQGTYEDLHISNADIIPESAYAHEMQEGHDTGGGLDYGDYDALFGTGDASESVESVAQTEPEACTSEQENQVGQATQPEGIGDALTDALYGESENIYSGIYSATETESIEPQSEGQPEGVSFSHSLGGTSNEAQEPKRRAGLFRKRDQRMDTKQGLDSKLDELLRMCRNRGGALVVTGLPNSGKTSIAFNIANIISQLGYSVLVVDMDTQNRGLAYIHKDSYDAIHSLNTENPALKQALNTSSMNISQFASILRPGFHILSMGLASDVVTGERLCPKNRLARFASNVRNGYNYIIYDIPFESATGYASDITYTADNVVMVCEETTHSIMDLMLAMCNIDTEDMQEIMFRHSQLCLNKCFTDQPSALFGGACKDIHSGLLEVDKIVNSLLGIDPDYYFSSISLCGRVPFDRFFDSCWFTDRVVSDTQAGREVFLQLLYNILVKQH